MLIAKMKTDPMNTIFRQMLAKLYRFDKNVYVDLLTFNISCSK